MLSILLHQKMHQNSTLKAYGKVHVERTMIIISKDFMYIQILP